MVEVNNSKEESKVWKGEKPEAKVVDRIMA
jgi:hypothetical protein